MDLTQIFFYLFLFCLLSCKESPQANFDLVESPQSLEIFAKDLISTHLYERDMAISPDGTELIYTLGDYKQHRRCLVLLTKAAGTWNPAEILPFSGEYQDIEPFFTPDGKRLFFASNRPMHDSISEAKDYNIWYSERAGSSWGDPVALDENINTPKDEFYPSLGKSGNLYFTATRGDGIGREDIFIAKFENGKYQQPQVLDSTINTQVYEFNAYIHPEEDLLIFSSFGRKDDLGGGDLYYSKKDAAGNWQTAIHMESPINSDKLDYCPFIDLKGGNFYFTSERIRKSDHKLHSPEDLIKFAQETGNGMGDIYRIGLKELSFE